MLKQSPASFAPSALPVRDVEIDLGAVLRTIWRGRHAILLSTAICLWVGWYEAYRGAVPLYAATSQLALQLRNEPVVNLDTVISGVSSDTSSMNTEMEIIRSRALIGRLVDELDLVNDPEFNPLLEQPRARSIADLPGAVIGWVQARLGRTDPARLSAVDPAALRSDVVGTLRDQITASTARNSYVFTITATTRDPDKSALIANTLARIYKDDQIRIKVDATDNAAQWLAGRVSELALELEGQQSAISRLRSQNALVSTEGLQALNAQAIELRQRLQAAQGQKDRVDMRLADIRAASDNGFPDQAIAASDPQLESIAAAIAAGDLGAELRFASRLEQVILLAEAESERLTQQIADLQSALDGLSVQFGSQSTDLVALQQLERETEATRVLYETFLARLKETTVQEGVHQADSRILSDAIPGEKVSPRTAMILALSAGLGLLGGMALVLTREVLQNTYRTPEDLERDTGLGVLGQIPRIPARARVDVLTYLRDKPSSPAAEAIRNLRTSILLSNIDAPPKVIMSTSSIPGEGKTTNALALAANLSGLQKRVLLMEGDIRRRTLIKYFPGASGKAGLLSVLGENLTIEEAIYHPPDHGFDVLMGEKSAINAADLFSSDRFQALVQNLREAYDYVVIDTPPVLVVPDARVIAQAVDAVIYSVNWDSTTRSQVDEGLRQFRSVNIPV